MKVVAGLASQELGARVAQELDVELIDIEYKVFPDNEQYIRLAEEPNEEVILVQSIVEDKDFVTLLLMIDALRKTEITAIIPYIGYARQDKKFKEGEPISARAIAEAIDGRVTEVLTVDVHNPRIDRFFEETVFNNLTAFKDLAKQIESKDNQFVLAPDEGAIDYAKKVAKALGADYDYLEKTRKNEEEIELGSKELDIEGKEVIVVDDIVSTGGTMSEAIELIKKQDASEIKVVVTHPVFARNAIQKLYSAGADEIITTDTIEKSISNTSVADVFAREIKQN